MKKLFVISISTLFILSSCRDSTLAQYSALGEKQSVEMYSGGKLVRTWVSSGKVATEKNSDGYYFEDTKTGKLVRVSGDIVITSIGDETSSYEIVPVSDSLLNSLK